MKSEFHVVTVLHNSAAQLPRFLSCLAAQTLRDWRLFAVDNASSDETLRLIAAVHDPRITTATNSANLGFARAANQGLRAALREGGQLVLLMNNDTLFGPDFFETMLSNRERLGASALVPRIMSAASPDRAWYAGGHFENRWVFRNIHEPYDANDRRAWRHVDFASGCCLLLTRGVLERIGLMDERFFVYWEDADYCMRLKQEGIPIVYVPHLSLLHEGGVSSGGEFGASYYRLYYRSYVQFLRKHFGTRVALRTSAKLLMKEAETPGNRIRNVVRMALPMASGLLARPISHPSGP